MDIALTVTIGIIVGVLMSWHLIRTTRTRYKQMLETHPEVKEIHTPKWYQVTVVLILITASIVIFWPGLLTSEQTIAFIGCVALVLVAIPTYLMRKYGKDHNIDANNITSVYGMKHMMRYIVIVIILVCIVIIRVFLFH